MKKNTKLMLIMTFLLVAASCKDSDLVEKIEEQPVKTEDVVRPVDLTSDEEKYKAQSDFENMLMDQVIFRDSIYVLNMSREEAQDLTIPDSLYNVFVNVVNNLNISK